MTSIGRLTAHEGALLVVDLQERLLAKMTDRSRIIANTFRLIEAAYLLGIPVSGTEQAPNRLGPMIPEIADRIPKLQIRLKTSFHCIEAPGLLSGLQRDNTRHVTLAGIEAHVCVAQTALELLQLGYVVQIAADAVTSRRPIDLEFALRRLERAGAVVSTTEAILFEWTERSNRPEFKRISQLIKSFDDRDPARSFEGLSS